MKKSLLTPLLLSLSILTVTIICTACSDDPANDARTQILDELILTPSSVNAGDSVTGVVTYKDAGKNIYRVDYTWTVVGRDEEGKLVTFDKGSWSVVDPIKKQPTFRSKAPDTPGIYQVTASSSRVNFSTGGPNGELYGAGSSATATLNVKSTVSPFTPF